MSIVEETAQGDGLVTQPINLPRPRNTTAVPLLVFGAVTILAVLLALHALRYMPFIADDSLISLRYSQRLLEGHGLTWTEGKRVEGYSNLLWILLVSGLGLLGTDPIISTRLLGFAGMVLAMAALFHAPRPKSIAQALPPFLAGLAWIVAGPVAVWTIGGLEQPLVACLLAWALVLVYPTLDEKSLPMRALLPASVLLGLLCLTRPDGALFTATAVAAIVLVRGFDLAWFRSALLLAVVPALCYVGQLIFRLVYYEEWIPNTALVKIDPSREHFELGLKYLTDGFLVLSPLSETAVLLGALALFDRSQRRKIVFLAVPAVVWSAYIVFIGGDIFPAWRHFIPLIVIMALTLNLTFHWLAGLLKYHALRVVAAAIGCALIGWFARYQFTDDQNRRAMTERWEWSGKTLALKLKGEFEDRQPLMAVTAAGCFPYWTEFPSLDMLGLNDYYLPRHPPKDSNRRSLAHALGDGRYVLDQKPDLIIYGTGYKRTNFVSGREMEKFPEFHDTYVAVRFGARRRADNPITVWISKFSEKTGILRNSDRIIVPAYFFMKNRGTHVRPNAANKLVVPASPQRPAALSALSMEPGAWRIEADASRPVEATLRLTGARDVLAAGALPLQFEIPGGRSVELEISIAPASGGAAELRRVILIRPKARR